MMDGWMDGWTSVKVNRSRVDVSQNYLLAK